MAEQPKNPLLDSLVDLKKTLEKEREDVEKQLKLEAEEQERLRNLVGELRSRLLHARGIPIEPQLRLELIFSEAISAAFGAECAAIDPRVRVCDPKFGDLQVNIAMPLKDKVGGNPKEIAEKIVSKAQVEGTCSSVTIAGPGFINIQLAPSYFVDIARYLYRTAGTAERSAFTDTVVIDYSSPNVAKEMHVGHLRSTVIGDALARMFEMRGHKVIRQNHIGDWGTQFGMLTQMMIEDGKEQVQGSELNAIYKASKRRFDADAEFKERSRQRVVLLQSGDERTITLWKQLVEASRVYFNVIYQKLGVTLTDDHIRGESSYNDVLKDVVALLRKAKVVSESEGATVAYVPGFFNRDGGPLPFIVQKGDGGFGYAATDLAAVRHRCHNLHATRILYVVDARQSDHFTQVFHVAKQAGFLTNSRIEHIPFGTIMGEDRKPFKTREGDTVRLSDLIDTAIARANSLLEERKSPLSEEERAHVARAVGVGAIKYFDLSSDRIKDYVFSYDKMLSFDGNTAPYLQYAYARIRSIFRKAEEAGIVISADEDLSDLVFDHPSERALILKVIYFNQIIDSALDTCHPHVLCTYLHELTTSFHHFYDKCQVLNAEGPARKSRLVLCDIVARTVRQGLDCLGISVVERM